MGLAAVNSNQATETAEVADGRDGFTPPVIAARLMHKGTGLDCLAGLHFAQSLNHTGRQDRTGIEKELSFPSSPFCPYAGRSARKFLNSASPRLRSPKNIAIISPHPDKYGHIWTGFAVFFLLFSHFNELYLPALPIY